MIDYQQALNKLRANVDTLPRKRVKIEEAAGYTLGQKISARADMPTFDRSAMDGYAVCHADLASATARKPVWLNLIGTIYAGDPARPPVRSETAVRIMTGAGVPQGADAVVIKENCRESGGRVAVQKPVGPGENIRRRGGEFKRGAEILSAGMKITPPVIGLLATDGHASVFVHRKPRITLVVTGNELIAPGKRLRQGQIYDANSVAVGAALHEMGLKASAILRLKDDKPALKDALARALGSADVVIALGGVSVGDRDFVKDIFEDLGVETIFWRVAIKPGKPTYFGRSRSKGRTKKTRKLVFGLPGNPVSALVTFHKFVKPALSQMMGTLDEKPIKLTATLQKKLRKNTSRLEWVRGVLSTRRGKFVVAPTTGQDSHMLGGLAHANCLIEFPRHKTSLGKNTIVEVELLNWKV